MRKHEQIERVRDQFARLMQAIAGMDEKALTTPAIGEWGVREVLAHMAGWTLVDTEILRRLARGERPLPEGEEYGTGDSRNSGFAAGAKSKSAAQAIDELRAVFDDFMTATEALPAERFAEGRTAQRIMQESAWAHIKEHRSEIESYRSTLAGP